MVRWTDKAFKVLSKQERNGKLIIKGEYSALIDRSGERMDFYGGSKTMIIDRANKKWNKKLRHIKNVGMGYAILPKTHTTQPNKNI